MGKPAARKTDLTAHAPVIVISGSPDTQIGKGPNLAARLTDVTTPCPICKIPNKGLIVSASSTVFVNRLGLARIGDKVACGAGAAAPPGCSPPGTSPYEVRSEDDYVDAVFADDGFLITESGSEDSPQPDKPPERKKAKFFNDLSMSVRLGSAFGMSASGGGPNAIVKGWPTVLVG